ncbi:MAG: diaminopimelate epimerase [SAR202 cluster bacterium]|nr:diaminopimelate epimerase [SAR202 cluster bacterium]
MKFTKMHGAGNDYVYINGYVYDDYDWPEISKKVSDRHTGIGSDGLIVAMPSSDADLKMKMFNADGSEGDMCGNGIRCLVSFAMDQGLISEDSTIKNVETNSGILTVEPIFSNNKMSEAVVDMGQPIFDPDLIPVKVPAGANPVLQYEVQLDGISVQLAFVSMGNPHAVLFLDEPVDNFNLGKIGPMVQALPIFPESVNFEIANILSPNHIKARVWERGSGLTMACGTGACAVAVAAHLAGFTETKVDLDMPGGTLNLQWDGLGTSVMMKGPVEISFYGEWTETT